MPVVQRKTTLDVAPDPFNPAKDTRRDDPVLSNNSIGEGLSDLGASLDNIKTKIDDNKVVQAETDLYQRLDDRFFNDEDAFYKRKGQNAFDTSEDFTKELDKIRQELSDGLDNDQQRALFKRISDKRFRTDKKQMSQYNQRELEVWDKTVSAARIQQATESAKVNPSIENIANSIVRIEDEIDDQSIKNGVGPEARIVARETAVSSMVKDAVIELLNDDRLEDAKTVFEKYSGQLKEDDESFIKEQMNEVNLAQQSFDIADQIREEGGTRVRRIERIRELTQGLDPRVRKAVRTQVINDFVQWERHEAEVIGDSWDWVSDQVFNGVPYTKLISTPQFQALKGDMKMRVQDMYESPDSAKIETNFDTYGEILDLINANTEQSFFGAKRVLDSNKHQLEKQDIRFLTKAISQGPKASDQEGEFFNAKGIINQALDDLNVNDEFHRATQIEFNRWWSSFPEDKKPKTPEVSAWADRHLISTDRPGLFNRDAPAFIVNQEKFEKSMDKASNAFEQVFNRPPSVDDFKRLETLVGQLSNNGEREVKVSELKSTLERIKK